MPQNDKIQLFEDKRIRTAWDEEKEEWYFSIVDVVAVLTNQPDQRGASNYWAKLKQRLKEEGADQLLTNCQQLKMKSPKDGKRYNTDVADTEQLLRIVRTMTANIVLEMGYAGEGLHRDALVATAVVPFNLFRKFLIWA